MREGLQRQQAEGSFHSVTAAAAEENTDRLQGFLQSRRASDPRDEYEEAERKQARDAVVLAMEAGVVQHEGGGGRVVLKKGPWTTGEDAILVAYVQKHGEGNWNSLQKHSGLSRCGKSCRLRWANHLRPNLKKGAFTVEEERHIIELHSKLGNKWARMAAQLPGRTDNEIKNYWNTRIKRRQRAGLSVYPPEVQSMRIPKPYDQSQGNGLSIRGTLSCDKVQGHSLSISETLPCDQSQGNLLHISTSPDSDGGAPASPKTEMTGLNLSPLESFSLPIAIPGVAMDLIPSHTFTMAEPIKGLDSPNNHHYPRYLECANAMSKCFSSSHQEPPRGRSHDPMLARGLPFEPDPGIGGDFVRVQPHCHGFTSGSYSFFGLDSSLKMELPSGQSVDAAGNADGNASALVGPYTPLSSSKSIPSEVDTFEPVSNSGLLECLLQEAKTKQRVCHFASEKDSSLVPILHDHTFASKSFWTEDTNASSSPESRTLAIEMEPIRSTQVGTWKNTSTSQKPVVELEERCGVLSWAFTDHAPSTLQEIVRPYELGLSAWYNGQASNIGGTIVFPVAADEANDVVNHGNEQKVGYYGLGPPSAGQFWELGSCQWNNMPGACLIGDYSADCRPFNTMAEHTLDPCAIF